eukprot:6197493-Pleurochrysis_carterae.AAC.1
MARTLRFEKCNDDLQTWHVRFYPYVKCSLRSVMTIYRKCEHIDMAAAMERDMARPSSAKLRPNCGQIEAKLSIMRAVRSCFRADLQTCSSVGRSCASVCGDAHLCVSGCAGQLARATARAR